MRSGLTARMEPASPRRGDAGFTMLEVVIAVLLIGGTLLTLVAAATNGVVYQGFSRQRQSAVGLANQVMEELRALPQETIQRGLFDSGLSADSHLKSCSGGALRLISCSSTGDLGSGEEIVRCAGDCATTQPTPLNPNRADVVLDGVTYTWHAYVTKTGAASDPLRLTVWVDWKWRGKAYDTRIQSLAAFPEGCVGVATHLVGPACGTGAGDAAGGEAVTITVSWNGATQPYAFSFGGASVGYQSGDPQSATAEATNPDGSRASALADADDSTSDPDSDGPPLVTMWSTGAPTTPGVPGYCLGSPCPSPVRARYYSPPLSPTGSAKWPSARAAAAVDSGSATPCQLGASAVAPCAVGDSSATATTTSGSGIVIEYLTGTYALPLVRIPAAQFQCGSSSNTSTRPPCFWKETMSFCYWGLDANGISYCAGPGPTNFLGFNFKRQVPRIYVGGRSVTTATGGGPCLTPDTTPCTKFLAEVFNVCDHLRVNVRTAANASPGAPSFASECVGVPKTTFGGDGTAEPGEPMNALPSSSSVTPVTATDLPASSLSSQTDTYGNTTDLNASYHTAAFAYLLRQPYGSGTEECDPGQTDRWTTSSSPAYSWNAGSSTLMTWCDRSTNTAQRLLWRLTSGSYTFATGNLSTGWSQGTTISFTYEVLRCPLTGNGDCKPRSAYTVPLTPTGGITVVISFPRLIAKPSVYDGW